MDTAEASNSSMLFNGAVFGVSVGVTIFCSYSASYFAKIASATPEDEDADTVGGVKRSAARSMMVVNIILAVLSGIVALWIMYRITYETTGISGYSIKFNRSSPSMYGTAGRSAMTPAPASMPTTYTVGSELM